MVKVIVIRNFRDLETATITLNRIRKRLPQLTSTTMMQWGKMLERTTRASAIQAGIKSNTGILHKKGIEWRQRPQGKKGELFIRLYGVYLDSMKPHYVSVMRRRSRLLSWAMQANSSSIRSKAKQVQSGDRKSFSIYVKPKPFIKRGYRRARKSLKPMLKRAAKMAVQNA